ncbi:hypothetical protein LJC47_07200, partial [Desulfosarcina sp. OttesenSCG-928-B08]|nr:hypothetical protein [Desulfosarcina sp. OttesenSCG-928-B08]
MFVNIILIFLLMYALEGRRNIPFLYTFTIVMSVSMLFFFIATNFGLLYYAKFFWICSAVILFLTSLYINKTESIRMLAARHYIFLTAMSVVFLLFYNGRIMGWDPFFWADFSRHIQINNDFWSFDSSVFHSEQHRAYPPGFALFSSIFMGLFSYKEYSQYLAFVTPLIFMILTTIKLCNDYFGSNKYLNFLLAFLCLGLVKTLGIANPVNFLSADIGIASFFTTCLLVAIFEKNISLATLFLAVTLPAFTLLKSTCILFSLTVILFFFVRTCVSGKKEFFASFLRVGILVSLALLPLLIWDHALTVRSIASTSSHLNTSQILLFFDQMEPAKETMLHNLARYFFLGPVISIYPKFLQPLTSTFALLVYSTILFVIGYKKEKGRQLSYLFCLLGTFVGWFLVYVLVITFVLPDALADYIVDFTYPRYVGPFICPLFVVALLAYIFPHGQNLVSSKSKFLKIVSIVLVAMLPLYALGIYQRAHPPVRLKGLLLSAFQEESEAKWLMIDASQKFVIQNTPVNSRIWTLLNESASSRHFVQMGFYLRPYRDNHIHLNIKPEMSTLEIRHALIADGVTHIFILSPKDHPLKEFDEFVLLPRTDCPVLIDINPWGENGNATVDTIVFEDAWWCKK